MKCAVVCFVITAILTWTGECAPQMKRSEFVSKLLSDYDEKFPPNIDADSPTVVSCDVIVESFDRINELHMEYQVTLFLRFTWNDPRLIFDKAVNMSMITLDAGFVSKFWVPDIFFTNSKSGSFHQLTVTNKYLEIFRNGNVTFVGRLSLILSCPMDLVKFPLDGQMCPLRLESFAFKKSQMELRWFGKNPVRFNRHLRMARYDLVQHENKECYGSSHVHAYPCLEIRFFLQRKVGFYLIQVYLPSVLIVSVSWISFWINAEAIPARVSLSVVTILAMITQSSGINAALPKVSYVKAIDVWVAMCQIFVFAALIQYAFISMLIREEIKPVQFKQIRKKKPANGDAEEMRMMDQSKKTDDERHPETKISDSKRTARRLDFMSRWLYPTAFLVFNIVYWIVYCSLSNKWVPGMP
ncbi:glycine receptor subunit alpha-2-like [Tubulanus polymorphus]|uniref:glycine receptor subunit alpha-2-like n=1 Tax=Tubulanus polymorphus TaxID=672921 RepID=UPI003DA4F088